MRFQRTVRVTGLSLILGGSGCQSASDAAAPAKEDGADLPRAKEPSVSEQRVGATVPSRRPPPPESPSIPAAQRALEVVVMHEQTLLKSDLRSLDKALKSKRAAGSELFVSIEASPVGPKGQAPPPFPPESRTLDRKRASAIKKWLRTGDPQARAERLRDSDFLRVAFAPPGGGASTLLVLQYAEPKTFASRRRMSRGLAYAGILRRSERGDEGREFMWMESAGAGTPLMAHEGERSFVPTIELAVALGEEAEVRGKDEGE